MDIAPMRRRVLWLVVVCAAIALSAPGNAGAAVWVALDNQYGVAFANDDAEWTIWKGCYSYTNEYGQPTTIGPGYIGRVTRNGAVLLNDEAGPQGGLNGGQGGLGTFGFHFTRGNPYFAVEGNPFTTDISGRHCSVGGSQGVYQTDVGQGPYVSGGVGVFDLTIWIRDNWGRTWYGPDSDGDGIGDAGVKLDYDIRVYDSVIKQWATVTTYFQPNWAGRAFVKEPKFVGGAPNSNAGWRRIALFGGGDGLRFIRTYTGNHPGSCAACHAADDDRLRVRYDFGTDTTSNSACADSWPCLNILFRAVPPGGNWTFWENGFWGLDGWANDAHYQQYANPDDQPNLDENNGPPYSWDCNSPSYYPASPLAQNVRRWEIFGASGGEYQPYSRVATLATGWEGGRGAYDCEPLYREPGVGNSYSVEMDYSINSGW